MTSYAAKQLRITLILATEGASFPGGSGNTLVLTGLRTVATVEAVARQSTTADIRIYGMLPADMNALTVVFFKYPVILDNVVVLETSDGEGGWSQVFSGSIKDAQPDYRGMPNVFFRILGFVGYSAKITPVSPVSFSGSVAVATICEKLAGSMGFAFENHGVTAQINTPYLPGTAYDQLQSICRASDTDFYFDSNAAAGKQGTLAIVPSGLGRDSVPAIVLNPQSGLIGLPTLEPFGITIDAIYTPNFRGGGKITVQDCDIPAANGDWTPFMLTHMLESVGPRGQWHSLLQCSKWGFALPDVAAS